LPSDDGARKKRKKAKKPLIGMVCPLTTRGLIRVRLVGAKASRGRKIPLSPLSTSMQKIED
jgi:hypothetical protein